MRTPQVELVQFIADNFAAQFGIVMAREFRIEMRDPARDTRLPRLAAVSISL